VQNVGFNSEGLKCGGQDVPFHAIIGVYHKESSESDNKEVTVTADCKSPKGAWTRVVLVILCTTCEEASSLKSKLWAEAFGQNATVQRLVVVVNPVSG